MPERDPSDAALMARLAEGETEALRALMDRWQRPLLSFNYRYVQDMEAARELTLETFIRVHKSRDRYDDRFAFTSWLFRIAANLCKNHQRWRIRHPEERLADADIPPIQAGTNRDGDPETPADLVMKQERIEELRSIIAEMPHPLKTALLLYYYEGLSYKEIADVIGHSVRGVETRLYRARSWLKERLGSGDGGPSTHSGATMAPRKPSTGFPLDGVKPTGVSLPWQA